MSVAVSIIFPAFNEALRIGPTLAAFDAFLAAAGESYELVVVDDGSTDATVALVRELSASMPALRCLPSDQNHGKGHAVRVGMLAAVGAIRVLSDADGSTPADQLPPLLAPIRDGAAEVAIGSRYLSGSRIARRQPFYRRWWSRFANKVIQAVLLPGIVDTHCGFKAFGAGAADRIFSQSEIDGWSFDLEVLALARREGFTIREVPVYWEDDPRSRIRLFPHMLQAVAELWSIRQRMRGTH